MILVFDEQKKQTKLADRVFTKPNLAPFTAKNIFPGPGLNANGNKKISKAMISNKFIDKKTYYHYLLS